MTPDIDAALRQERLEIARMLHAEAAKHEAAAAESDWNEEPHDASDHRFEAATLNKYADLILARTPTVAVEEAPEIAF